MGLSLAHAKLCPYQGEGAGDLVLTQHAGREAFNSAWHELWAPFGPLGQHELGETSN